MYFLIFFYWFFYWFDSKSTPGNTFFYKGELISRGCSKHNWVAHSTTESEYITATKRKKNAIWFNLLETELETEEKQPPASKRTTPLPVTIFCDIQRSIQRVKNPEFHLPTRISMFATTSSAPSFNGMLSKKNLTLWRTFIERVRENPNKFARLLQLSQ